MVTRVSRLAMRTRFEIVLSDANKSEAFLRAAGEEALGEIERADFLLSAYWPGAALFRVNAAAGWGEPVRVEPAVIGFLACARELAKATNGAFDLSVGPLLRVWKNAATAPTLNKIKAALDLVGMDNVHIDVDASTVWLARPGARLDPGAIGKGWALERATDLLREAGVENALLHGGTSTVVALGGPWNVAVRHPRKPERLASVALQDQALSVSAARSGHIVDPRTGRPVEKTMLAAVVATSATDTDAVSTGLLVEGEAGLPLLSPLFPHSGLLVAWEEPSSSENKLRVGVAGDNWREVRP